MSKIILIRNKITINLSKYILIENINQFLEILDIKN